MGKKIEYFFSRQGWTVDAGWVCGFKGLHKCNVIFYASFTNKAVLFGVKSTFIVQELYVGFTYNTFGILFVPFFGCVEEQVVVKRVKLFGITQMGFKFFDEVVP